MGAMLTDVQTAMTVNGIFFVRMFVENFRVTAVAGWQQTVATFCGFFFYFWGEIDENGD